jgi:hypothetical protein
MNHLSPNDFLRASHLLKCDVPAIQAVTEVESPKGGFNPDGSLIMLFEPHIFWKQLRKRTLKPELYAARKEFKNILSPTWNPDLYPKTQTARYEQLRLAITIHSEAAFESCSWGAFQILGRNATAIGYKSAKDMVEEFKKGEPEQLTGFVRYILSNYLDDELRNHDWKGFAHGYNGPEYQKNKYDELLESAYQKFNLESN